jgi:hypothetical protein
VINSLLTQVIFSLKVYNPDSDIEKYLNATMGLRKVFKKVEESLLKVAVSVRDFDLVPTQRKETKDEDEEDDLPPSYDESFYHSQISLVEQQEPSQKPPTEQAHEITPVSQQSQRPQSAPTGLLQRLRSPGKKAKR